MAKLSSNKTVGGQYGATQGIDRVIPLLGLAVDKLKVISDSIDSVSKTVDRRKTTDTDNAVKVTKAETQSKKEDNRHGEAMAKIELEYKKISEASANGELKWSMIQDMVQMIRTEADRLNGMDDAVFLSEEAQASREELHKIMLKLSKEIIRAR